MDLLAQTISQKVDHSCIQTLKSDVDSIRNHAQFVKDTQESIKHLQTQVHQNSSSIQNQQTILSNLVASQDVIRQKVPTFALQTDLNDFQQTLTEFVSCTQTTMTKQHQNQNDLQMLQEKMQAHKTQAKHSRDILQKLQLAHEKLATYTANRFGKVYSKEVMDTKINKCITLDKFHRTFDEYTNQCEERSVHWDSSLTDLYHKLQDLERRYDETRKRSILAAEFIDWYGRKGDAYEHNMNAVDGHLRHFVTNHNDKNISL